MIPQPSRQCSSCQRYNGARMIGAPGELDAPQLFVCDVFPEGIPDSIIEERFDHRRGHPQDNGNRFVAIDAIRAREVEKIFAKREGLR